MFLKGMSKSLKKYMVKFNVSIIIRLKIMVFFVNSKYIHKPNIILIKLNKPATILTKCFFPISEPYKLP